MRFGAFPRTVANFVGFQATWLACAVGAANGLPLLGPGVAVAWLWLHVAALEPGAPAVPGNPNQRAVELRLLTAGAAGGYLFDGVLVFAGTISFPEHAGPAWPTTPWMVALWIAFAATLRHSLNRMRRRYGLAAIAGAVFGPFAYMTGDRLGALTLAPAPAGWLAVAAGWALAMPLLLWLRERIEAGAVPAGNRAMDSSGPATRTRTNRPRFSCTDH